MPEKQYFEGIDIASGGTVISSADVADTEARASLEELEDYVSSMTPVALSVTENGTYTAPTGVFGYSPVTVAVSKDFYPKAHATLDDASRVEGDDMRVYPMGGTDYYPYVYLGVKPYGTQEEYEPVGKYFAGRSTEYTVSIFLSLINVETGESATGYPQQVAPTQANFSIVSGGYCRIKAWSVISNGSAVNITIERYNPTYTKPIEGTYGSASVTPSDALQSYLNTSYYVAAGMTNRVTYVGTKHTVPYTFTAEEKAKFGDVVGIRLFTESSPAGSQAWIMGVGLVYAVTITMQAMYYFITPNNEQLPANSYMDADITYAGGMTKSTISEMLLNPVEQRGIIFGAAVPSFALIYSYPPSSQG